MKSLFFLAALCSLVCLGQFVSAKSPIKFGKPDLEDLKMKVYTPDSTAEAVVLCSYGYFDATRYEFTATYRIKILKKSGTSWGTKVFNSTNNNVSVRGITFNLEGDEVIESKLKNESILKKKMINSLYTVSVAMPNVKEGSVIDLEVSSNGLPHEWRFQDLIPVRYSELTIEDSPYINYQSNFFGYIPFDVTTRGHWEISNIPAFKKEPYMDSYTNYINKVEFDLQSVNIPGVLYEDYASSWEEVGETLDESSYFGRILSGSSGYLKEIAEEIEATCSTKEEKLKTALDKIKCIKWNNENSVVASTNALGSVYKDKLGNSADINLMLINLLERLDIKAYPIVLSTRDNGQLSYINPSLNKLNYIVCGVPVNENIQILDATEQKLPFGLLPERVLNDHGRILYSKEKTDWIRLKTDKKDSEKSYFQLTLNRDFSLEGKVTASYSDYGAYNKRTELYSYNSDEDYIRHCEQKIPGLEIKNLSFQNKEDIDSKLVEVWDVKLNDKVDAIDDMIMINFGFSDEFKESPFKLDTRVYPVNYPYCFNRSNTVMLQIPEGYEVMELPEPAVIRMPGNSAFFMLNYSKQGNIIVMNLRFDMNKQLFLQDEYPILKEFYTQIIKKQAQPLILKVADQSLN
jgi:hypothetical protein